MTENFPRRIDEEAPDTETTFASPKTVKHIRIPEHNQPVKTSLFSRPNQKEGKITISQVFIDLHAAFRRLFFGQ